MREVNLALSSMEYDIDKALQISLHEAFTLCCIGNSRITPGVIATETGLRPSHLSKVIAQLERNGWVERSMSEQDKRQYIFSLTEKGLEKLHALQELKLQIPDALKPLFEEP